MRLETSRVTKMKQILVVLVVGVQLVFATKFPAYVEKCTQSDPKFGECVVRNANKALKRLLQGDPEFDLPQLVPLNFEPMHLDVTENVQFVLTNGIANVADDLTVTAVEFDFEKKSMFLSVKTSRTFWYVDYELTGKIHDKPLHETGKANITYDEHGVNCTVTLDFKTVDDKKYLEATASDAHIFTSKYDFKPYNKETTGQPFSDAEVQEIAALYEQSGVAFQQEVNRLSDKVILLELNSVFKLQPFNEIFLP